VNAITKSLEQSRAVSATAYSRAVQMKNAGIFTPPPGSQFSDFQNQRTNRERYGLFRGWLYSAVHALAEEAAGQPVNIGKLVEVELREEERSVPGRTKSWLRRKMTTGIRTKISHSNFDLIEDHPLLDALEKPNSIQHRWQFVYNFVANLNLTGWSYIIGGETNDGGMEFFCVPTTWVHPIHTKGPFAEFKVYNPRDAASKMDAEPMSRDNVAFAYLPNPADPLQAMPPAQAQLAGIRIDDHIQASQERFFENGVFPSVVLTVGKNPHPDVSGGIRPRLTGAQHRQVISAIQKKWSGVANYGVPAIVDGMIESIERLSATQNEMGWEKSEMNIRTRILSAFGVHPYILGEPVGVGGYAQVANIEKRFCKRVNTFLDMLSCLMTNFAVPMVGASEKLFIWWEECAPTDPALRQKSVQAARKNGDVSRNEIRAELGYPPREEPETNPMLESPQGLTAAVGILTAMAQGAIQSETAVLLFTTFYGLPEDQAKLLVGKPGEVQAIEEATEAIKLAVEKLSKPVKVEYERISKEIAVGLQAASRSTVAADRTREDILKLYERIRQLTASLEVEKAERKCDSKVIATSAETVAKLTNGEIQKALLKMQSVAGEQKSEDVRAEMLCTVLKELAGTTDKSLEAVKEIGERPINVSVVNEVKPTPVEITTEVNPTPVEINVENDVQPSPVSVKNLVETPEVKVQVDPKINVKSPRINVEAPNVQVEPKVEVRPNIKLETPPAEVNVNVTKDSAPRRAVITHPDQRVSQVELKD